jgi:hypothetical protein
MIELFQDFLILSLIVICLIRLEIFLEKRKGI